MIIKVEGLSEAINTFSSIEIATALNAGIRKSIFAVDRRVKRETPVDTGRLNGAWRQRFGRLTGELVNTAKYAPYVHNGTRPHTISIRNKKALSNGKVFFGRVVNHPGNKANPFLKRAVDQEMQNIPRIISSEV